MVSSPSLNTTRPPARRLVAVLAAGVVAAVVAAGCGVTHVNAPTLTVVTSVYPLAQAMEEVGGAQVHVIDLATANVDPRTMKLSAAQVAEIHHASLVVDIGDGFQPSVEAAARGAQRTLSLQPALRTANPYVWLDPHLMMQAAIVLRDALTKAEPAAKTVFSNGEQDFAAELSSLDIDFENSLSDCPESTFVTSDDAFAQMAKQYGVVDHAVGTANPDGAQVAAAAAAITQSRSVTAFEEPWVSNLFVSAAAQAAGVKLHTLNTIETPPASGSRAEVAYSNLMEVDLTAITGAMQCPSMDES
jgi:zinc transport system substrate-binding protein